eukprot:4761662-Prymnesium_polylepis.1
MEQLGLPMVDPKWCTKHGGYTTASTSRLQLALLKARAEPRRAPIGVLWPLAFPTLSEPNRTEPCGARARRGRR